jgi:small subunit ribosomal protein S20
VFDATSVTADSQPVEAVVPNVKSAEKRMRTNKIREQRNKSKRSRLRTALKNAQKAETPEAAAATFLEAKSLLDRAAARRLIHPNKAARLKSRLAIAARAKGVESV